MTASIGAKFESRRCSGRHPASTECEKRRGIDARDLGMFYWQHLGIIVTRLSRQWSMHPEPSSIYD